MARYVMANLRAGKATPAARMRARLAMDLSFGQLFSRSADILRQVAPQDLERRQVVTFEADAAEVAAKRAQLPADVVLEPEILHHPVRPFPPLDLQRLPGSAPQALGKGRRVTVNVRSASGAALAHAGVDAYFREPGQHIADAHARTDANGAAFFEVDPRWHLAALIVSPYSGHWNHLLRSPGGERIDVVCDRLPASPGWWAKHMTGRRKAGDGTGIRVGVVDTGCGPHPALQHVVSLGAFIDGARDESGGADVDTHGSHVCGTIGARPGPGGHAGLAPGAVLYQARVFAGSASGADQGDIALAIDALTQEHGVHLINLSLGAALPSNIERDAIADARDHGALCICAAGNNGPFSPAVCYPAAFPESVAVSALGLDGAAPAGSMSASRIPLRSDMFAGELFLANFSCHGPEIATAAPGVAIVATVPERHGLSAPYAVMDGTSMAAPLACAALARVLSSSAAYRAMPADGDRALAARRLLVAHCADLGLDRRYQGSGLCLG